MYYESSAQLFFLIKIYACAFDQPDDRNLWMSNIIHFMASFKNIHLNLLSKLFFLTNMHKSTQLAG